MYNCIGLHVFTTVKSGRRQESVRDVMLLSNMTGTKKSTEGKESLSPGLRDMRRKRDGRQGDFCANSWAFEQLGPGVLPEQPSSGDENDESQSAYRLNIKPEDY